MASANQRKATFISNKLQFLKDQEDDLINAVGHYVNKITTTGYSWTPGGGNNMEFQELCQMIDTAAMFLCEKSEELADLTSQSITETVSTPATSDRQAAAPLASTATTSYRQSTESVQPADEIQLKPVLAKIAVIEEAMCSFRSRTEKVAEQQSGIDQQLKEVLSKLSESDKKHSSRFKHGKQQSGIDQQLKEVLSKISESDQKHSSSLDQVKQQISDISETQDAIEREQKTRLQCLEEELQKISTAQNRQKEEMQSQAELVEKLVHVPNLLESVKENVVALDDRVNGIIDNCRNKHEDIETVARDLADNVMANTQSVQVLSEVQDKMTSMMKKLETRLQTLEADGRRNVKDVQKQIEKGETHFQILCQMLNDRLKPLELRTCLNERASMQDDNVTKLSQLIQEVAVMSPRLQQLEVQSSRTRCGFSAATWVTGEGVADNITIRQYNITYCNVGENFNADSGIFTAPVDGLYVASISLRLSDNEHLSVGVQYTGSLDQLFVTGTTVCWSSAVTKDTSACNVSVVDMKAGEVLYSFVDQNEENNYHKLVTFSCFLLG